MLLIIRSLFLREGENQSPPPLSKKKKKLAVNVTTFLKKKIKQKKTSSLYKPNYILLPEFVHFRRKLLGQELCLF